LRQLLEAGADANSVSGQGNTQLKIAAMRGLKKDSEIVKLLIEHGADVSGIEFAEASGPGKAEAVAAARPKRSAPKKKYGYYSYGNRKIPVTSVEASVSRFRDNEVCVKLFSSGTNAGEIGIMFDSAKRKAETVIFRESGEFSPDGKNWSTAYGKMGNSLDGITLRALWKGDRLDLKFKGKGLKKLRWYFDLKNVKVERP